MTQSTSGRQARLLGGLLVVPEGARRSELDRLRNPKPSRRAAGWSARYVACPTSLAWAGPR
jgi:hypothetical protein